MSNFTKTFEEAFQKEFEEQKAAIKWSDIEEKRIFLTREKVKRQHLIKKIREEIRDIEEQIKDLI